MANRSGGVAPRYDAEDGDDSDRDDPVAFNAHDVYATDPLDGTPTAPSAARFSLSNYLPWARPTSPFRKPQSPERRSSLRRRTPTQYSPVNGLPAPRRESNGIPISPVNGGMNGTALPNHAKQESVSVDWYTEGPGKRVGYDDLTAIDWIFEYAKERQRLRVLYSSATGLLGHVRRFVDASHIWLILVLTGIATGLVAASIDVASDWLGDLKRGMCRSGTRGGKFYLNRSFCCWGLDEISQCQDWWWWSGVLGVSSASAGYTVEYIFFVVFSVIFASCASVLVKQFAAYAKQSGIPEVKTVLGGFVMKGFLGGWTLIVKSAGLCLAVASGLWLGKEGPLVHVACCCAHIFLRLFPTLNDNEARKREVLSAAAAAGISVAFGAPVGGVLFSLEQLSFYFPDKTMWQSFVCAMIAAVTLQAFNPFRTGKLVLYQVTYLTQWHGFELVPFALLGIIGGIYGGLLIKLNMLIARLRKRHITPLIGGPIREVALVAFATALINFPNKFMRAQSTELVATLFSECSELKDEHLGLCGISPTPVVVSSLLAAAALGFLLTSVTFGLMVPAGIILPSMAIGALLGRTVGLLMRTAQESYPDALLFARCEPDVQCVTAGTYAIIGAAAALAGATRMTISIVVIMFELTGALTYVLPIMISVMLSKWVGDAFGTDGIYESWIKVNGYPFLDNRDDAPVPDIPAAQVMTRLEDLIVLPSSGLTIQMLDRVLKLHPCRGFPVVADNADAMLLGYISRTELTYALKSALSPPRSLPPEAGAFFGLNINTSAATGHDAEHSLDLRPWMDQTPITLSSRSSLQLAADMFLKLGLRYVLFVERGCLRGLLTKKDVWYVLNSQGEKRGVDSSGRAGGIGTGIGRGREERGDELGEYGGLLAREGDGVDDERGDGRRVY